MQFKTNAKCVGCMNAIISKMNEQFPNYRWSMDLDNADKILECHGVPDNAEEAARVVKTLEETGFKGSWIQSSDSRTGY
ncbi:MAG: heavy metal transport/detoxification protein [Muribaculaceae bacterium]|nr:heavy metal transport/detoxification protein [Muribaculaceae bacterium]